MEENLVKAGSLFGRCESCVKNLQKSICALTCSPIHSIFLRKNVSKHEVNGVNVSYVSSVEYDIGPEYVDAVYESCSHVVVPATGGFAMDMACGLDNSKTCTGKKWFTYMGNVDENPVTPFQITYMFTTANNAFNSNTKLCNESYQVRNCLNLRIFLLI